MKVLLGSLIATPIMEELPSSTGSSHFEVVHFLCMYLVICWKLLECIALRARRFLPMCNYQVPASRLGDWQSVVGW